MTVVLDSWAVLRYLEGTEPAAEAVGSLLRDRRPLMSWINRHRGRCVRHTSCSAPGGHTAGAHGLVSAPAPVDAASAQTPTSTISGRAT